MQDEPLSYFEVDAVGLDIEARRCYPLTSADGMIGGFTLKRGSKVACFACPRPDLNLMVAGGYPLYFTPIFDPSGYVTGAQLTSASVSLSSIRVEV